VTSRSGPSRSSSLLELFLVALRLGLTSFGGPIAHLGYFRSEYVVRRRWLDEMTYADLVALCQSLPGPTSSEVGIAIGLMRAGPIGAFLAWLGFTLPSAILMVVFAYTLDRLGGALVPVVRALGLVAIGIVAFAVWRMARALAWDVRRGAIALAATALALVWPDDSCFRSFRWRRASRMRCRSDE
jgi:chromate transporter